MEKLTRSRESVQAVTFAKNVLVGVQAVTFAKNVLVGVMRGLYNCPFPGSPNTVDGANVERCSVPGW
jgi:hypothetical protein